jgi:hypothetical protein
VAEPDWITHREAAELLGGVHITLISKMLRRGDLTTRGKPPALSRNEVLELAAARETRAAEREARRKARRTGPPQPPDDEHLWLLLPAAAEVMGCSSGALKMRATRGKVPFKVHDGRRWFRLDHLELLAYARPAQKTSGDRATYGGVTDVSADIASPHGAEKATGLIQLEGGRRSV